MILRKPYAFFIKHFKLFNIILTILEVYMIYKLSFLVQFLFEYSSYPQGAVGRNLVGSLLSLRVFILGLIIILFSMAFVFVLSFKKKPVKLYLFIMLFNIVLLITLFIVRNYLQIMQMQIIENRTAFALRDFTLIGMIISVFIAFLTSIRSLGFDIKKFQFSQDLHDLNISDEDNEEFEIQLDVDSQGLRRNINRNIRYFKYFIKEHKLALVLIVTALIGIVSSLVYSRMGIYFGATNVDQVVKVDNFSFGIGKSYITEKDYRGNIITDNDKTLIVIPLKIKTNSVVEKLNVTRFALNINGNKFYHTTAYKDKMIDLGTSYNNSIIKTTFENYVLVFEIPKSFVTKTMYLEYNSENDKQVKFKIKKVNLDGEIVENKSIYNLGDMITFKDKLIDDGTFSIDKIEINDKFRVDYQFCISDDECYKSYEYVVPNYTSNYNKTLIKINGNLSINNNVFKNDNLGSFVQNYGAIVYKINGETKINPINLVQITTQKAKSESSYYIEAVDEVKSADNIILKIKLRNVVYTYNLK